MGMCLYVSSHIAAWCDVISTHTANPSKGWGKSVTRKFYVSTNNLLHCSFKIGKDKNLIFPNQYMYLPDQTRPGVAGVVLQTPLLN